MRRADVEQLLNTMGGPSQIARELQQFSRDVLGLDLLVEGLEKKHPNGWVASFEGTRYRGRTLDELRTMLENDGVDPNRAAIQFLEYPRRILTLVAA